MEIRMRINISSTDAENIIDEAYDGESKPLTKTSNRRNPNDIHAWQSNPREEQNITDRKRSAITFYLELTSNSVEELRPYSFPAIFDFSDGKSRYPDKGIVKSLLGNGLISHYYFNGQLVFILTETGQEEFIG